MKWRKDSNPNTVIVSINNYYGENHHEIWDCVFPLLTFGKKYCTGLLPDLPTPIDNSKDIQREVVDKNA